MMPKREWSKVGVLAVAFALVAFALVLPAGAQEQVGSIRGTVTDASAAVLPGASIEAVSAGGTRLTTMTNSVGEFRFPRVPPGTYSVIARLDGFTPAEVQNVAVALGDTATVNMTLEVGAVTETISVIGEAGQVDTKSSATAKTISSAQIEMLPKGRDFTGIATQAAGASQEGFAGGLSIDGASGSENRFVIDGVDTTDPQDGVSGQDLVTDFIDEVQVKSAGYQAEYGGSIGGVVNAVTKSGTNEFKGSVGLYYGDRDWDGGERALPYRGWESAGTIYRTFDEEDITRVEPIVSLGGPIVKDKAWFFAGYTYTEVEQTRTPVRQDSPSDTPVAQPSATQNDKREYLSLNVKGNVGSQFLYKVSGNFAPRTLDNTLPARDGTTPAGTNFDVDTDFSTESYSAYADWIPSDSFYLSGRVGFYTTNTENYGSGVAPDRIFFRNGVIPVPTTDPLYRPTGFATYPSGNHFGITDKDLWEREAASLDGNVFFTGAGSHSVKGGVQYERVYNDVLLAESGNLYEIRWGLPDRFGANVQGTQGSVHVRRFGTFGEAESKNLGLYLQDTWTVLPNLTLNLGVRTEKEEVPNYGHQTNPSLPVNAWEFSFSDKLAPRVGFAWDIFSDSKLKVYGSYGTYYDISKIEMSRGSFGGDRWIAYLYPLNTVDWTTVNAGCTTATNDPSINPCPALGIPETRDLREPTDPSDPLHGVDPDLKPMEQTEYQLGADWQFTQNSVLGFRYVNKSLETAIEDIGFFVCENPTTCAESYFVGNPGKGPTATDPAGPIPGQPLAVRDYEAIELTWDRRFTDNWSARVGYTYSQLEGNWSGLGNSDEFGRTDPNVSRAFDSLHNSFDRFGNPEFGPLNTDRPHAIDAQFIYRFGWGTSIGINQYYGSGTPISTQYNYNGVPFFAYGRKDQGRTDDLTQTDLLLAHPFKIGDFTLEASLNVLNLFDEDTALLLDPYASEGDLCGEDCDGSQEYFFSNTPFDANSLDPAEANPFYLKPNAVGSTADPYQVRRTVRVGLKFMF